jgi:hypothetical protein
LEEKSKTSSDSLKEAKKNKQKNRQESKPVPQYQADKSPHESKIKSKLPPSKLSTVESHVQSYMGQKLDSNVAEQATAHLKPFVSHITGEAPKGLASKYNDYGSSTPPTKATPIIDPAQLYKLMNDQNAVRNAVILSEILTRPDFTRFKKPSKSNS